MPLSLVLVATSVLLLPNVKKEFPLGDGLVGLLVVSSAPLNMLCDGGLVGIFFPRFLSSSSSSSTPNILCVSPPGLHITCKTNTSGIFPVLLLTLLYNKWQQLSNTNHDMTSTTTNVTSVMISISAYHCVMYLQVLQLYGHLYC